MQISERNSLSPIQRRFDEDDVRERRACSPGTFARHSLRDLLGASTEANRKTFQLEETKFLFFLYFFKIHFRAAFQLKKNQLQTKRCLVVGDSYRHSMAFCATVTVVYPIRIDFAR